MYPLREIINCLWISLTHHLQQKQELLIVFMLLLRAILLFIRNKAKSVKIISLWKFPIWEEVILLKDSIKKSISVRSIRKNFPVRRFVSYVSIVFSRFATVAMFRHFFRRKTITNLRKTLRISSLVIVKALRSISSNIKIWI